MPEQPRHPMTHTARALRQRSTDSERALWEQLRDRRFRGLKFRRQQPVGRFVLDFYCAELKLAIEVDGPIHGGQVVRDAERQQALEASGITVVRVSVQQLTGDIEALLDKLIPPPGPQPPKNPGTPLHTDGEGQG